MACGAILPRDTARSDEVQQPVNAAIANDDMDFWCGSANDQLAEHSRVPPNEAKLGALLSGLGESARTIHMSDWVAWGVLYVMNIPDWLASGVKGRGGPLLGFLIFGSKIIGGRPSTLKRRLPCIRFMNLFSGNAVFSLQENRANAIMRGLRKGSVWPENALSTRTWYAERIRNWRINRQLGTIRAGLYISSCTPRALWDTFISL